MYQYHSRQSLNGKRAFKLELSIGCKNKLVGANKLSNNRI
jgi:hypothetical protein